MSKGSKQQFKQFTINSPEDACLVLKSLIVPVVIDLEKFYNYSLEAEELLKSTMDEEEISAKEYDSIHDKVLYQQRELLRFIADHQTSAFSYIDTRAILVKRGYLKRNLTQEIQEILNELLNVRNWYFHNAQSMLVAELEIAKRSIPPELQGMAEIKPVLNPVIIWKVDTYSRDMLESFVLHNKLRGEQFEKVLMEMKADYQEMFDSLPVQDFAITNNDLSTEIQYVEYNVKRLNSKKAGSDIANLSMGIQKGKFDGTNSSYEKIISSCLLQE